MHLLSGEVVAVAEVLKEGEHSFPLGSEAAATAVQNVPQAGLRALAGCCSDLISHQLNSGTKYGTILWAGSAVTAGL